MKKHLIFLLLLITSSSCVIRQSTEDKLMQHDWIAINSKAIHGGGITPYDGMLMNFESSKAKLKHIFFDSTLTYNFSINEQQIYLDDSIFGKVEFISEDSLLINFDDWMLTKYIPVEKNGILISENELIENEWICHTDNEYTTLKIFTDLNWGMYPNETAKICVEQDIESRFKGINQERWNIVNVDNSSVLSITWGQTEPAIYFVQSKGTDSIQFNYWLENESYSIVFKKIPYMEEHKLDSIKELVSKKTWETFEIIDYAHQFSEDSALSHMETSGVGLRDTTLFKKESFINKGLSFSFKKDFTYEFFENKRLALSGSWKLSKSGKQIVLDYGCGNSNFIDIIEITDSSFTLGKLDKFSLEKKGHFTEYYYIVKLK